MTRRLLITRPAEDNAALAGKLAALGIEAISSPLTVIERQAYAVPATAPEGILLTSRHAAYACADFRDVPLYVVGAQTAEAAKAQGCRDIRTVAADAAQLLSQIPPIRRLVYLSGEHIRFDFATALPHTQVERIVVYAAHAAEALTPEAVTALHDGSLKGVAFYSPRSAAIFHRLAAGVDTSALTAYCLSPAIAETCREPGKWRHAETAEQPDQEAMLHLLAHAK